MEHLWNLGWLGFTGFLGFLGFMGKEDKWYYMYFLYFLGFMNFRFFWMQLLKNMKPINLIKEAVKAKANSKSKYSNFAVGTALLSKNNKVILGCNVESAVYPSTLCAERVAIFSALSQGYDKFKMLAVVTTDGATPCGSCRQIIYEQLGDIPIYISDGKGDDFETFYIKDLLPHPFG